MSRSLSPAWMSMLGLLYGCGSVRSPSAPATIVPNAPPVIQSLTISAERVEAGSTLQLTAAVSDAETPTDQLGLRWSVDPAVGNFVGSGIAVQWQAPLEQPTPAVYVFRLAVTEDYREGTQLKQHVVSATTQVHYNDSRVEITGLSLQFLQDFTTYDVSPEQCVRNFHDACPGKADELYDISQNRKYFHILGGDYSVSSVVLSPDRTFANVNAPCTFYDTVASSGRSETVKGTCLLTATYDKWRWWLCDSHFQGISTTFTSLRYRSP